MKLLYLLDASNWAHAAHHADVDLGMMIDAFLRRADDPDVVAALDGDEPTFRQELFPGFKSGREEKPPDLVALLARLPEVFGAAGVRTVEPPQGYG